MGDVDSHSNTKLRAVLDPVSTLAEDADVAVVSITHFNKGGAAGGVKAVHRVMGGAAFTTAPRAAFAVVEDPDDPDRRLFLHLKNNLGPKPQGLAFRLEQRDTGKVDPKSGKTIVASCITWETQPVTTTADEAVGAQEDPTAKDDAIDFLTLVLARGPLKVMEIEQEARDAGLLREDQPISQSKPFRSARKALGIEPYQPSGVRAGGWIWEIPGMGI
jgi:putative DNA primase/helicase